ncbi:hypothetical protein EIP86_003796 [Pleurotus ostreatoroseus]|nr:hypothetical protein EIP86_003796 [Pleurotus ostreatoroseus]
MELELKASSFALGRGIKPPLSTRHAFESGSQDIIVSLKMTSRIDVVELPSQIMPGDAGEEKNTTSVAHMEKISGVETNDVVSELLLPSSRPIAERNLVRILDLRLLPTIFLIYMLNSIDVSSFCLYYMFYALMFSEAISPHFRALERARDRFESNRSVSVTFGDFIMCSRTF